MNVCVCVHLHGLQLIQRKGETERWRGGDRERERRKERREVLQALHCVSLAPPVGLLGFHSGMRVRLSSVLSDSHYTNGGQMPWSHPTQSEFVQHPQKEDLIT